MFDNDALTCFKLGESYLLVEIDDENPEPRSENEINRTCIRINVENVKKWADRLESLGIKVNYGEFSWGTVAKFHDPDGNLIGIKDTEKFEKQIEDYKSKTSN